jgi:hypothetical protein
MTTASIAALKGEVLYGGAAPSTKVSALKAEVMSSGPVTAKLVMFKAEVLHSIAVYTPPVSRRRVCVVVTR